MSVVVSVRVPRWVKERLERSGVNVAELVRRVLLEEAERLEEEELRARLREAAEALRRAGVTGEEVARLVREDREGRGLRLRG